jgi:tetratricopeptide (TPR) repeat protein
MISIGAGDPHAVLSVITRGQTGSDPWERAVVHLLWGYPQIAAGDLAQAEHEFSSAVDAFRSLGDRWGTALALDSLAWLAGRCGDLEKAIALTDEALTLTEQLGAVEDIPDLLCNRGDYRASRAGEDPAGTGLAEARADYERAAEIARRAGSPTYLAAALRGLGDIARLEGDLAEARRLYEQALERFEPHWMKSAGNRTNAFFGLGKVAEASGDLAGARSLYRQAIEVTVRMGPLAESAREVEALAGIALLEGDASAAALLLGVATSLRGVLIEDDPEVSRTVAAARAVLGEASYETIHRDGVRLPRQDALRLAGVPDPVIQASLTNAVAATRWSLNAERLEEPSPPQR